MADLYAFPSPEQPGDLSLVLGVLPRAPADACFSSDILCRFRLRPVTIGGWRAKTSFPLGPEEDEIVVTCSFDAPRAGQEGTCKTSDGQSARFVVGDEAGGRADGLRVFAGRRSDPLHGFNLLSIVVEIDCVPWLLQGKGPLFAVVGETVAASGLPIRIERFGRPGIENVVLEHPLTELVLADYLVVDVTKPYATDSFFEIERATLEGRVHKTCGGRSLNGDGRRVASDWFPYLAPPLLAWSTRASSA
jgi:hypothetical protein